MGCMISRPEETLEANKSVQNKTLAKSNKKKDQ